MKLACLFVFAALALAQAPQHAAVVTWVFTQTGGDPPTGYHVQRSAVTGGPYTNISDTAPTAVSYTDTNVKAGDTWFYVVTPFNTAGTALPSNEVACVIPFSVPLGKAVLSGTVK